MSEPIDIAGIGQRARRAAWQDGILELFGGLFFLFYLGFARSQGDKLYLALAAALVILGIALSQVTRGLSILLVLNSAILLLYGIYKLIRFVIRYPRADGRGGGNDQFEDHAGS